VLSKSVLQILPHLICIKTFYVDTIIYPYFIDEKAETKNRLNIISQSHTGRIQIEIMVLLQKAEK
jgi:hypothetical protein